MNPNSRYTNTAIALHWLMAIGILGAVGMGWYMTDLKLSPQKLQYYSWHKWMGVTLFLLVTVRLIWRLTHRPPAPPAGPLWQQKAGEWTHRALYLLMLVIPLTGWLHSSAAGYPVVYLGLLPLPDLVDKNKELSELFEEAHEVLATGLVALVALHTAAALKHHLIDRDGLLRRMWFGHDAH